MEISNSFSKCRTVSPPLPMITPTNRSSTSKFVPKFSKMCFFAARTSSAPDPLNIISDSSLPAAHAVKTQTLYVVSILFLLEPSFPISSQSVGREGEPFLIGSSLPLFDQRFDGLNWRLLLLPPF